MRPADEKRRYIVTASIIPWAHAYTDLSYIYFRVFIYRFYLQYLV